MNAYESEQWEALMAEVQTTVDELAKCSISVGGTIFDGLVASSLAQKVMGMTNREFDGFDALLFVETEPVMLGFQNRDVPIDIAVLLFDASSAFVESFVMKANDATIVRPSSAYSWALEVPAKYAELNGNLSVIFTR